MVNKLDFSQRIQQIMDTNELSASALADKIGVQRSSISHILSGRNKPSLDFITKLLSAFPNIDLHWLINGKEKSLESLDHRTEAKQLSFLDVNKNVDDTLSVKEGDVTKTIKDNSSTSKKEIERIVIFFKDGSYKNYES